MKNSVYWKLSAFFFVYFFSWLVFFAFLPIWFGQKLQLSGMQIGQFMQEMLFLVWYCSLFMGIFQIKLA